ncbi:MAG: polyprenol monophosphomannose synthase [Chloroflexi bacterium]|nr:polyprenol monophosphomannose synthase [Chloroflexota bacterium]
MHAPLGRTLVVVPTYNERDNLARLAPRILAIDHGLDVLIVDDNSPDGTGAIADRLALAEPRIRVIHRAGKLGLGTAYVAGFKLGLDEGYDRMVEMDADFSHRPADLARLIEATQDGGADVAIGSRLVSGGRVIGWSALRHIVSQGGSWFARLVLDLPMRDCTSGFKCFRRSALERLELDNLRSTGFAFQVEVNHACARARVWQVEVPIVFEDRRQGTSKMSWRMVVEAVRVVLWLRLARRDPAPRSWSAPLAALEDGTPRAA